MTDARELVKEMSSRGLSATKVTYNELLNAKVAARDRMGMWRIVDEMLSTGLKAWGCWNWEPPAGDDGPQW
eukprot:Skav200205  [mRNA]  locus=scaffold623:569611:570736:- [translate_table: standard]